MDRFDIELIPLEKVDIRPLSSLGGKLLWEKFQQYNPQEGLQPLTSSYYWGVILKTGGNTIGYLGIQPFDVEYAPGSQVQIKLLDQYQKYGFQLQILDLIQQMSELWNRPLWIMTQDDYERILLGKRWQQGPDIRIQDKIYTSFFYWVYHRCNQCFKEQCYIDRIKLIKGYIDHLQAFSLIKNFQKSQYMTDKVILPTLTFSIVGNSGLDQNICSQIMSTYGFTPKNISKTEKDLVRVNINYTKNEPKLDLLFLEIENERTPLPPKWIQPTTTVLANFFDPRSIPNKSIVFQKLFGICPDGSIPELIELDDFQIDETHPVVIQPGNTVSISAQDAEQLLTSESIIMSYPSNLMTIDMEGKLGPHKFALRTFLLVFPKFDNNGITRNFLNLPKKKIGMYDTPLKNVEWDLWNDALILITEEPFAYNDFKNDAVHHVYPSDLLFTTHGNLIAQCKANNSPIFTELAQTVFQQMCHIADMFVKTIQEYIRVPANAIDAFQIFTLDFYIKNEAQPLVYLYNYDNYYNYFPTEPTFIETFSRRFYQWVITNVYNSYFEYTHLPYVSSGKIEETDIPLYKSYYNLNSVIFKRLTSSITSTKYTITRQMPSSIQKALSRITLFGNQPIIIADNWANTSECNYITDYFTERVRMKCKFVGYEIPENYWPLHKSEILAAKKKQKLENLDDYNYYREVMYEDKHFKTCNNFRITVLMAIYSILKPTKILDICAGWGDRLLAAIGYGVDRYIGVDPNKELHPHYRDMVNMLVSPTKRDHFAVIEDGFETADLPVDDYDLVLFCPPFFDLETYSKEDEDSIIRYPDIDSWYQGFVLGSLDKAYDHLAPEGFMFVYLYLVEGQQYVDGTIVHLDKKMRRVNDINYADMSGYGSKLRSFYVWQKLPPYEIVQTQTPLTDEVDKPFTMYNYNTILPDWNISQIHPSLEIKRKQIIENLVTKLYELCRAQSQRRLDHKKFNEAIIRFCWKNIGFYDPVIPYNKTGIYNVDQLVTDLINFGLDEKNVYPLLDKLNLGQYLSEQFNELVKLLDDQPQQTTYENHLLTYSGVSIPCTDHVYQILEQGYKHYSEQENLPQPDKLNLYFCIIYRYQLMGGGNQQLGASPDFKEGLSRLFAVNFELFGSCFNRVYQSYCSLYYDLEKYFGSVGNFFDIKLNEGIYFANPPFDETIMKNMGQKLLEFLQMSEKPLGFFITIPIWDYETALKIHKICESNKPGNYGEYQVYQDLISSKYYFKHYILCGRNFQYHNNYDDIYVPASNTYVFVIKNDKLNLKVEDIDQLMSRYKPIESPSRQALPLKPKPKLQISRPKIPEVIQDIEKPASPKEDKQREEREKSDKQREERERSDKQREERQEREKQREERQEREKQERLDKQRVERQEREKREEQERLDKQRVEREKKDVGEELLPQQHHQQAPAPQIQPTEDLDNFEPTNDFLESERTHLIVKGMKNRKFTDECDQFRRGDPLKEQGAYSINYHTCKGDKCDYISKVIPLTEDVDQFCLNPTINEMNITQRLSDLGIGAHVETMCIRDNSGVIIKKYYDGTFTELIVNKHPDLPKLVDDIESLVRTMHSAGFVSRDIRPPNILYDNTSKGIKLVLNDFGLAIRTNSQKLRERDLACVESIRSTVNSVLRGEIDVADMDTINNPDVDNPDIIFVDETQQSCDDWQ